jgi:hypothetical protein
MSLGAKGLRL